METKTKLILLAIIVLVIIGLLIYVIFFDKRPLTDEEKLIIIANSRTKFEKEEQERLKKADDLYRALVNQREQERQLLERQRLEEVYNRSNPFLRR
jgi:uncharacterized protein YpmB